jgi:hypothetical protein
MVLHSEKEKIMLEVTVHDVVVSLPAGVAILTQPQACKEHEGLVA